MSRSTPLSLFDLGLCLLLAASLVACDASSSQQEQSDCEALHAREVDLRVRELGSPELAERHRENLLATRTDYMGKCRDWSNERIQCALEADDAEALRACHRR